MGMTLIEEIELASTTSVVTFSGISQDYRDLRLVISARSDRTGASSDVLVWKPNNLALKLDTHIIIGTGTSVTYGTTNSSGNMGYLTTDDWAANIFSNVELYISNYTSAGDKYMSVDVAQSDTNTAARLAMINALANSIGAITSLEISLSTGDFKADSTFSLYGIY